MGGGGRATAPVHGHRTRERPASRFFRRGDALRGGVPRREGIDRGGVERELAEPVGRRLAHDAHGRRRRTVRVRPQHDELAVAHVGGARKARGVGAHATARRGISRFRDRGGAASTREFRIEFAREIEAAPGQARRGERLEQRRHGRCRIGAVPCLGEKLSRERGERRPRELVQADEEALDIEEFAVVEHAARRGSRERFARVRDRGDRGRASSSPFFACAAARATSEIAASAAASSPGR